MASRRKALREALEMHLIKSLRTRGFDQVPLMSFERESQEFVAAYPFGRFKRQRGEVLDVVEVEMSAPPSAKFVINFGNIPSEGVRTPEPGGQTFKLWKQSDASIWFGVESYCLLASRFAIGRLAFAWFGLSSLAGSRDVSGRAFKCVNRAIRLLPEMDEWFLSGKVGPHMRRIGQTEAEMVDLAKRMPTANT